MDYRILAEQLLGLRDTLRPLPLLRELNELEHGIYYALHCLEEQGEICPKDLARSMAVSPARIAALLRHMEKEGLIARLPDPSDNRQVRISATAVGIALIRQRREQLLRTLSAALAELGPEDAAAYLRLRRRFADSLRRNTHPKESAPAAGREEAFPP